MDFRQDMSVNKTRRLCGFYATQNSFILVVSDEYNLTATALREIRVKFQSGGIAGQICVRCMSVALISPKMKKQINSSSINNSSSLFNSS
jgi:phosphopantetheine adenylyltransferase